MIKATTPQRAADVSICECFARDGLQHEPDFLATAEKAVLVELFANIGFSRVEATSYSNPKVVPQFADASDLLRHLPRRQNTFYKATCANTQAVERALLDFGQGHGVNEISLLVSASESHSQRNLRRSRAEQWENIARMVALAGKSFRMVGTISVAFGCPFEGRVDVSRVLQDAEHFMSLGLDYVTIADTTGMAGPHSVRALFRALASALPELTLIAHFHDARGTGLVNCLAALEAGVTHFDSAFGGVGGHPAGLVYGGGYTGNVCTEDLVSLFEAEGIRTGLLLEDILAASRQCEAALRRQLHSKVARSGPNPLISGAMPARE